MDKQRATAHVAKMLASYAANIGPQMLDQLSHPLAKIVLTRDGGAGVAISDEQPHWFAYAYAATLPGLTRWKRMTELAGQDEPDTDRSIQLEVQAFHALSATLSVQMAAEACDRMFVMSDAPEDTKLPAVEPRLLPTTEEVDDVPRPRLVHIFIWVTYLALIHASTQVGGIIGAVLVGGPIGLVMAKGWGARIPNAVLLVFLPLVFVVALVTAGAIQNARRHPTAAVAGQGAQEASALVPGSTAAQNAAAEAWNNAAAAFEQSHPDLKLGSNEAILQEKLQAYANSTLSATAMLDGAYAAAIGAPGWTRRSASADENAEWSAEVEVFLNEYPALRYGNNLSILQEKLNQVARPNMTNRQMLQAAYDATLTDRRWSQTP